MFSSIARVSSGVGVGVGRDEIAAGGNQQHVVERDGVVRRSWGVPWGSVTAASRMCQYLRPIIATQFECRGASVARYLSQVARRVLAHQTFITNPGAPGPNNLGTPRRARQSPRAVDFWSTYK